MKSGTMTKQDGFTLLEMTFAVSILAIVGALSFVALQGSTEATSLTSAKAEVQANLRNVVTALSSEVRLAYTDKTIAGLDPQFVPESAQAIQVSADGLSVTFTRPEKTGNSQLVDSTSPITYRFENEDGLNSKPVNGKLEPGEDANGDGMLTRRMVRIQNGQTEVVGGVNDISDVQFQLRPDVLDNNFNTTLYIRLQSSKGYGPNQKHLVRAQTETTLHLQN